MNIRVLRRLREDAGSTMVEFTLVAFMFVIVLLGVVELGRMVLVFTTVTSAARAGTRYAIVHGGDRTGSGIDGPSGPGSVTQVQNVVKSFASAGLLNTTNLTVNVSYPSGSNLAGNKVDVTVTYPFDPLIPYFTALLGNTLGSTREGVILF